MRLVDGNLGVIWTNSIEPSSSLDTGASLALDCHLEQHFLNFSCDSRLFLPPRGIKRPRVDETDTHRDAELPPKKKRRLRVDLITSMLSRPFAAPSTYIPTRKSLRAGPWARQRIEGRDLLRKAAIFNKIAMKRRTSGLRGIDHRELTRQAALIESCPPTSKLPSRSRSPHDRRTRNSVRTEEEDIEDYVPFDAFDLGAFSDDEDDKSRNIVYSDFNTLRNEEGNAEKPEPEDEYSFDSFDTGQGLISEDGEKVMVILKEAEKMSEVSLAPAFFTLQNRRRALDG